MLRIPYRCYNKATYFIRTFRTIPFGNNGFFLSKKSVGYLGFNLHEFIPVASSSHSFQMLHFVRWFNVASCLSKGKDSHGSDDNGHVGINDEQVHLNDDNKTLSSNNVILEETGFGDAEISTGPEFLGIEVFPEIFNELPPKCPGCGAILQSRYESKPGYVPEKRNPSLILNKEENAFISETICMRCFNIKHYNKDLPPVVSPESISKFLTHISRRKALILYNIDIMDVPGSFIPDILNIVGETKHFVLVCNKLDRLAVDGHPQRQMERMKTFILNEAGNFGLKNANIKDVCMISAKTGFGVQDLVKAINQYWKKNSDIYIVGCNNSGKTTLFNLLADLFAASRHSEDLLKRGTTSPSPGNTLSLLRFPITHHRFLRLQDRLRHGYSEDKNKKNSEEVELDEKVVDREMTKYGQAKEMKESEFVDVSVHRPQLLAKENEDNSWLYDTPGLYSKHQITHLLTNKELKLLNPALWFVPRTLILKPGKVLFIGGLARLDYLDVKRLSRTDDGQKEDVTKASQSVFFTVFASPNLPIHVTSLERADVIYGEHAGNELLKVPCGGKERMEGFAPLSGRVMEVTGVDWKESAADITLSSIGWISVTAGTGSIVSLKAYTPNGVGLFVRDPPLLPTSVRQRGKRGVPYLGHVSPCMYQGTRKRSPSLAKFLAEENIGTTQWMEVAEKKRKKQRLLLKFEKAKWHGQKKIGFSARSNPSRYLACYEDDPELDDGRTNRNEASTEENNSYPQLENNKN